jgi:Xaa-Pro aminopeptidase
LEYGVDLFDKIWDGRPALPKARVFEHDARFAGQARAERIAATRAAMGDADGLLITTLDDVAWLLNLRGSDVECNPVAIAHCLLEKERAYLFVGENKVPPALEKALLADGVHLRPYGEARSFLHSLRENYIISINPTTLNAQLYDAIPETAVVLEGKTPTTAMKAIKNSTEVGHIRQAMARDAVALLRLFRWLDEELDIRPVSEVEVSDQLIEFRKMGEYYYGESFPAIVGYKGNGAIVHYRPLKGSCARLKKEGILLLDSGGQYHDGTTDITRTVALGTPTPTQKRHFTLVLKGHIALATQHFPKGTTGMQLDTLTRQFLWKDDLNFGHGTGHGVGFFLNVHEGPQGIGPIPQGRYMERMKEGMFTSNEPGLYITGEYGIRIENLILAVPAENRGFGDFLRFDTLTLFPIDLNLVEDSLLTKEERDWLNDYHQEVWDRVSPLLEDEGELDCLRRMCAPLGVVQEGKA